MLKNLKTFLFKNKSVRQTVAKNAFWLALGNVGGRLLRAAIIIYAARLLGASDWGIFSFGLSVVALITIFTDFGLNSLLTREIVKTSDEKTKLSILGTTFVMRLSLLVPGIAALISTSFFMPRGEIVPLIPAFVLILIFDAFRDFGFALGRAMEKMEREAILFLATNIAIVVFGAFALVLNKEIVSFSYAYMLGTAVGTVLTFLTFRINARALFAHMSRTLIRPLLSSAWPFATAAVLGALMINTNVLLIGIMKTPEDVGHYSAAQRIILLLYLLPTIIATSAFPALSKFAAQQEKFRGVFERAVSFSWLLAIPMALGGALLAEDILQFLFGSAYLPGTPAFAVLLISLLANYPAVVISNALFALNQQKILLRFALIGALSNVALNLIFIPTYGIAGSAWATLFSLLVSNIYLFRRTKEVCEFKILPFLPKIVFAAGIMFAATATFKFLAFPLLVNIFLSILVYLGMLLILRELLLEEAIAILRPRA